ncbi:RING finger protein nhl-1 isoform X1 [Ixodes scapularis]|uniref:RING finger protein nhl-1 isoform X1 n=1 Tax=Ixodes scapularis TaxID=6945 RepID=UPI001A9F10B7|nr:RING finger protein nhl-1 isoform X1 [Ixodes scapularis]XP_029846350.2 RING finger protein nhl-1 isoform X1 [Ixodes scapularis]
MTSAWSQLDQLLTCAICLDRYRNPKLLPCQHSFCADPCLEGLQDYARRQIKCPECRAETRIPYNGVQTFPTNVTLMRFLELHRDITGEEPEPLPSSMERCNVCSEKSSVTRCSHCEKKICEVCKEAHLDIMRREISRICNQVRRGLNRLAEHLAQNNKNQDKLTHNCALVKEELEDLINRYVKDLQLIHGKLKSEIDVYLQQEIKQLSTLSEDVETEIANITSNCDVVEKYVNDDTEWTDSELVEYKEIFNKSLEFLRNFDPDTSDFTRRVKLQIHTDPDALHRTLANLGELKFNTPPTSQPSSALNVPQLNLSSGGTANALMRSQSDHRLAVQFQKKQDAGSRSMLDIGQRYGGHLSDSERDNSFEGPSAYTRNRRDASDSSILRRYGDRSRDTDSSDTRSSRYGSSRFEDRSWRDEGTHHGFRSRYARELMDEDNESGGSHTRNVRFEEPPPPREKVFDTDDANRGPLSGVVKLSDSAKFMERLHENQVKQKQKQAEKERLEKEPPVVPVPPPRRPPARQMSEDEVEKQKKAANQAAAASTSTTSPPPSSDMRPSQVRRLASKDEPSRTPPPDSPRTPSTPRQSSVESTPAQSRRSSTTSEDTTTDSLRSRQRRQVEEESRREAAPAKSAVPTRSVRAPLAKAVSVEQDERRRPTGEKKEEATRPLPQAAPQQSSFFSRLRPQAQIGEEEDSDSEGSTTEETSESEDEEEDEEDEEEEEEEDEVPKTPTRRTPTSPAPKREEDMTSSVSALLNRSAQARRGSQDVRSSTPTSRKEPAPSTRHSQYARDKEDEAGRLRSWRDSPSASVDDPTATSSRYGGSSFLANRRRAEEDQEESGASRFLSRSRSSALVEPPEPRQERRKSQQESSTSRTTTSPATSAAALRRSRLARSKSSNEVLPGDLDSPDEAVPASPSYRSRYKQEPPSTLSRSKSSHAVKDASPDGGDQSGTASSGASSSWAQYLRNKYGCRTSSVGGSSASGPGGKNVSRSRSSHVVYNRSGSEENSSDDEVPVRGRDGSSSRHDGQYGGYGFPRSMYLQKRRMQLKIGTRGTEPGCFTWPRGVAVGPDNSIVVADSSNHRVQVFDSSGRFQHEFGTYGSSEGEFDCLAGVAVNRIGQFIVSDRYNHRIQIFDPSGRFLRSFGCEGRVDARFNYPWGITTDSLGFIYVCDKENHRVQVFQSDGTFVGKFGSLGSRPGHLEHPHYVAVSNTNRVIVSDSNNHRIQIFDVNGRSLSTFGSEGSDDGQFKFPRGVAVDDQGYIMVGDSGNNRIQIFHPDGSFLRAFGQWGSGDGEFKGLEGIAVMPNGSIVVCDRENHRIQVF